MLLPYGDQSDRADAELAIATIHPDQVVDLNIKPAVDAFVASYSDATGETLSDFHKGNAKARERMIAQYALAGMREMCIRDRSVPVAEMATRMSPRSTAVVRKAPSAAPALRPFQTQ